MGTSIGAWDLRPGGKNKIAVKQNLTQREKWNIQEYRAKRKAGWVCYYSLGLSLLLLVLADFGIKGGALLSCLYVAAPAALVWSLLIYSVNSSAVPPERFHER